MTPSAELREAARKLLRLAETLDQDEQLRRYLLRQAGREPAADDCDAFDRCAGGVQ